MKGVNLKLSAVLVIFIILLSSCEKLLMKSDPANDPVTNFEILWTTLDQKYSLFSYKDVDWDEVYNRYSPRVDHQTSNRELFNLMGEMLNELKDGHVNLIAGHDISRYWDWYLDAPPNFNWNIIQRNYLGDHYEITGPLYNAIIDSIGYVYYGSFASPVSASQIDYVMRKFQGVKGVIFDIRNNGGGSLSNVYRLASRFADQERLVLYEKYKDGPGKDDFTDLFPDFITPEGELQFTGPVVVLTNRRSYSAANHFALFMNAFPHVTQMGDATGGGGGIPADYELPIGWRFRFSNSVTFTPDLQNVEDGIPPEVEVHMRTADELRGKDTMLEEALEFLR